MTTRNATNGIRREPLSITKENFKEIVELLDKLADYFWGSEDVKNLLDYYEMFANDSPEIKLDILRDILDELTARE
jgi:hypothetical protein